MRAAVPFVVTALVVVALQAAVTASGGEDPVPLAEESRFWIDPTSLSVEESETFTVTVMAEDVQDMVGYAFKLHWNSSVLTPTEPYVTDAGFLEEPVESPVALSEGTLSFEAFMLPPYKDGADGDGPLAVVTFQALAEGTSVLHLDGTDAEWTEWSESELIQHVPGVSDGEVRVGRSFVFLPVVLRGYQP